MVDNLFSFAEILKDIAEKTKRKSTRTKQRNNGCQ